MAKENIQVDKYMSAFLACFPEISYCLCRVLLRLSYGFRTEILREFQRKTNRFYEGFPKKFRSNTVAIPYKGRRNPESARTESFAKTITKKQTAGFQILKKFFYSRKNGVGYYGTTRFSCAAMRDLFCRPATGGIKTQTWNWS